MPEGGSPLYDLTSSGINKVGNILEPNEARVGRAFLEENIGLITVDWEARTIRMALIGSEGRVLLEEVIPLATEPL